jgi:predicted dehydrogenase
MNTHNNRNVTRRSFLQASGKFGVSVAGLATAGRVHAKQKPEKLRVAIIGIHGRGGLLASEFAARPDCEISYLCDVERSLLPGRAKEIEQIQGRAPQTCDDFRTALDDKSVDAIVVATPDHWHALATIWGCQAGKDVYVEKPVSHTPWEGRKMIEASRRYKRIVQVGTQSRSAPYMIKAKNYIESGKLGHVHFVRVVNQKSWPSPALVPDRATPKDLNWDMWTGPASLSSYNENRHRQWNHFWSFSGGDIINDSIHQIDIARWLIGKPYPQSVTSTGGKYTKGSIFETPDTQVAMYQFDDLVMVFELTLDTPYMIKSDPVLRDDSTMYPYWPQNGERVEIYGTSGLMIVGRHGGGWQVFGHPKDRKPVIVQQEKGRFPDKVHIENFFQSVRNRTRPNADIEEGHHSTLLSQFANISYRLAGRKINIDSKTETVIDDKEANQLLRREYRQPWVVPDTV